MRNFKIQYFIALFVTILLLSYSCKKEDSISDKEISKIDNIQLTDRMISNFVEGESNDEVKRMLNAYQNCKNSITIMNNLKEGKVSKKPQYASAIGGVMDKGITIKINGTNYSPDENGSWHKQGAEFKNYYGTDVRFEVFSYNKLIEDKTIYVPKEIYVKLPNENKEINRTGNILSWEPDFKNVSKKVFLYYTIFDSEGSKIYGGIKGVEDYGTHSLDRYIKDPAVSKISFKLIRGNLFSTEINGEKAKFSVVCIDYHTYSIK